MAAFSNPVIKIRSGAKDFLKTEGISGKIKPKNQSLVVPPWSTWL